MLKTVNKPLKNKQGSEQVPEHTHGKLVEVSTERSHEVLRHWFSTDFYILTMEVQVSTAWYWPCSCASPLQHKLDSEQLQKQNKKHKRKRAGKSSVDPAQMSIALAIRWPPWIQLADGIPTISCLHWPPWNPSELTPHWFINQTAESRRDVYLQCLKKIHFAITCPSYHCVGWCPHLSEAHLRSVLTISLTQSSLQVPFLSRQT